jgi:ABC-2 type transport system permease protein
VTRAFLSGVRIHVLQFTRNAFDMSGVVLWPILYASIAYYLLDARNDPRLLLSASVGAAVMTMWSLVVVGSSGALENQRWQGTLELLVAAPVPFAIALAPITISSGIVGAYSLVATLVWGTLLFDVPFTIDAPLAFAVAVPTCALAVGMLGLIMAAAFVLYRAAFHLGIAMQYPVWIVTGLLARCPSCRRSSSRSRGSWARPGASAPSSSRRWADHRGRTSGCASCSAPRTSSRRACSSACSSTSPAPARPSG